MKKWLILVEEYGPFEFKMVHFGNKIAYFGLKHFPESKKVDSGPKMAEFDQKWFTMVRVGQFFARFLEFIMHWLQLQTFKGPFVKVAVNHSYKTSHIHQKTAIFWHSQTITTLWIVLIPLISKFMVPQSFSPISPSPSTPQFSQYSQ